MSARLSHITTHLQGAPTPAQAAADEPSEEHVFIPARDGVRLACSLCRPAGDGPWPALVTLHYASDGRDEGSQANRAALARARPLPR